MTITVKDQVSMLYGRIIADELGELGLLASDSGTGSLEETEPTLWRVRVRNIGKKTWQHSGLASEFNAVAVRGGLAVKEWSNESTARRQATMAKNRGLEVVLVPCVVVELQHEAI